ncbi:MAG: hypothetical protein IID03_01255 [Candidatus Dadabacteria bacterium]|nr:hypothetical protein [Candidatus Dadabacteria bacterium]
MTEKSSLYNDYFNKLFQIWENAVSQTTINSIRNDIFENSTKWTNDKTSEFNEYMKDIMSKSITHNSPSLIDDIDILNKSIERIQSKLDILSDKVDKLTGPTIVNNKRKNK